jgi:hypothetical protein
MQIFEKSKNFTFDRLVLLSALQGCFQELHSQWVKTKLCLEKPSNFTGRQGHSLRSEVCKRNSEPGAKLSYAFTWFSFQLQVKQISQLSTFVKCCFAIDAL